MPLSIYSFLFIFFLLKRVILNCLNIKNMSIYFFIVKLARIWGLVHLEDTFTLASHRVYSLKTLQYSTDWKKENGVMKPTVMVSNLI